eukprot:11213633-Lingulodinium_polyedra.AAC.1
MTSQCPDAEDHLSNLWTVFASLRNSASQLADCLGAWVASHVLFVDPGSLPHPSVSAPVWCALGLSADKLDEVANEWRLLWDDGHLLISWEYANDGEVYDKVCDLLIDSLHIHKFSTSRWLTVGRACRSLCLALALGLESWVADTLKVLVSDWHLKGFRKVQEPGVKSFALVVGMAAHVADSVLELMLSDPRGCLHCDAWADAARDEVLWLASWRPQLWAHLTAWTMGGAGFSPRVLMDRVLQAALTMEAFMQDGVFHKVKEYPWCLAKGDVEANLAELRGKADVGEATTWKIQQLSRMPGHRAQLVKALLLLRDVSWTTNCTEQQHASVRMVRRHHPDFHLHQLLVRSGLHCLRRLLPEPTPEMKLVRKLRHKLDKESAKQSNRVTGRMMFFKEKVEEAKELAQKTGTPAPIGLYTSLMTQTNQRWPLLPAQMRARYEAMAQQWREGAGMNRAKATGEILSLLEVAVTREEQQDRAAMSQPLQFSSCP